MSEFFAVGIGGFIGSCARYGFTKLSAALRISFPLGTLLSNAAAGILVGFFIGIETYHAPMPPKLKLFLVTGLMGGLSTFSTFSLETVRFIQEARYVLAAGNTALNLCLSLGGVVAGMLAAKLLFA